MERAERERDASLLKNQPYDESLEVLDPEEVHSPQSESTRSRRGRGLISTNSDDFDEDRAPQPTSEEEEEEEEEEEVSDEEDSDEDEDPCEAPEGVYDPADYANLPVSTEIKELFQYITRYSPQALELDHSLKPFIPDFIPAVGDIDAFLKVPRPDGKADGLGLMLLDEPSVKQSDPTVMSLWLSEESKQQGATELKKVTSVPSPRSNPRVVDSWVDSIGALHRSKPPTSVQFGRSMPDIDSLMQEWSPELEQLIGRLQLPPARLHCGAAQYADTVCALLDIPVYGSRIQSLYLLFSLYLEFRDWHPLTQRD
ncbi:intraflagellar transport protein 46 homolog [Cyclopterus lumpus]|uniref:intraflagellar transport protein 46 homolog n=1 Tax=Cyclopterus lumpus TaxID=8103 RepID=UPI0014869C7C|nr:intraflagellar transport protein 46 homolog [Cyclopterus lumpus]XP_034413036.1 intraflagellar transport protein 46 homolog [Cyclopterus lumpus]XP_034413037.1 intraflagellar transport protein 46 homolog [Cyclopterus lumpus]